MSTDRPAVKPSAIRAAACFFARLGLSLLVLLTAIWGGLALWYQSLGPTLIRGFFGTSWALYCLLVIAALWRRNTRLRQQPVLWGYLILFTGMCIWWVMLAPSNNRVWADDVARITHGTVDGPIVTLENVRNFQWRSETDYTPRWETRQYNLDQLTSVDMILSYWGSPAIAHTLVSFGFANGEHVVFSVEIRKERHEAFSEIGGFFKQFEMSVVAADERDIVYVRTAVRGERVYLYPIEMPVSAMRALFLSYVERANGLVKTPRFYHTLWANCTTIVYSMVSAIVPGLPMDYRILLSGYLPEYIYDIGGINHNVPLEELRTRAYIGDRAAKVGNSPDFSRAIREDSPASPALK